MKSACRFGRQTKLRNDHREPHSINESVFSPVKLCAVVRQQLSSPPDYNTSIHSRI
jgi:hypothetical protein